MCQPLPKLLDSAARWWLFGNDYETGVSKKVV
jgi:hypothetical protein